MPGSEYKFKGKVEELRFQGKNVMGVMVDCDDQIGIPLPAIAMG
jgi:hypothetical protein